MTGRPAHMSQNQWDHYRYMNESRSEMHRNFERTVPGYDNKLRETIDRFIDYPGTHEYEMRSIYTGRIRAEALD